MIDASGHVPGNSKSDIVVLLRGLVLVALGGTQ